MKVASVMPNYGFDELVGSDSVEFKVTPPEIGRTEVMRGLFFKIFVSFCGLVFGCIVALFFYSKWALSLPLIGAVATWMWASGSMHKTRSTFLKVSNIKVSMEGVFVDGESFAREHISDFWVGRGKGEFVVANHQDGVGVARYGDDVMSRMFSVQMRYGAEPVVLATGVTEGTANVLLEKVLAAFRKYAA